jgi:ribonuclease P protein component
VTLVAHYLSPDLVPDVVPAARAGFVVGRAVGNSVVRHRTVRRLRHLVRDRYDRLPAGSLLVVRALPPAAGADSAGLGRDLDAALDRLLPALAASAAAALPPAAAPPVPAPAGRSAVTVTP